MRTERIIIQKNSAASGFLDFDILSDDGKIYSCSLRITEINKKAYNFIKTSDGETLKGKILTLRKSGRFYIPVSALWGENVTNIFF